MYLVFKLSCVCNFRRKPLKLYLLFLYHQVPQPQPQQKKQRKRQRRKRIQKKKGSLNLTWEMDVTFRTSGGPRLYLKLR
jgi:hypothetical protein